MWVLSEIALGKAWQCDRMLFWLVSCTAEYWRLRACNISNASKAYWLRNVIPDFWLESQLDMGQLETFGMMWINIWLVGLDENTYAGSFHFSKNLFQIYLPSFL